MTPEPKGELAIRVVAMPKDTNPSGDVFGGWLISQMDLAGIVFCRKIANFGLHREAYLLDSTERSLNFAGSLLNTNMYYFPRNMETVSWSQFKLKKYFKDFRACCSKYVYSYTTMLALRDGRQGSV